MGCYLGDRLIHVSCGLSSPFFRALGNRAKGSTPMWEHGFEDGRRREDAMLVWGSTSWRLAQCHINNISTAYDFTAAFHYPPHADLDAYVVQGGVYKDNDHDFINQMFFGSTITLDCIDGSIDHSHGSGLLMGNSRAPKDFNHAVRPLMMEWASICDALPGGHTSMFKCKINNL